MDAPPENCAKRDPKGFYTKAIRGEISNFTGVDNSYERPERSHIRPDAYRLVPVDCVEAVMRGLV